jgi:hypothetical protein
MLSRKNPDQTFTELPLEWCHSVQKTLEEAFSDGCKKTNKRFDVFSELYKNEIVIATSLTDQNDQNILPITYLISCDLKDNQKYDLLLDQIIDQIGTFFDQYFMTPHWDEYEATWQELSTKENKYYYMISRENILLTKLADQLLKKLPN